MNPLPSVPLVSIVIPSYQQGRFLRETLSSCLAQSYRPLEVLVMDGGSTDETVEVLRSFEAHPEVQWVSEPDDGVADAVNKGMARARGAICAIQSSDDGYLPGAVEGAVAAFRAVPEAALIYGDTVKQDAAGRELLRSRTAPFSITRFLSKRTLVLQPAAFFRREAFEAVGGWSPAFFNADTECWLRMILRYPAHKVDAYWAIRRMHEDQRDRQAARILADYQRMMNENSDLRHGPARWRRAARCGSLRHRLRYGDPLPLAQKRRVLWQAVRAWPPVLGDPEVAGLLFPWTLGLRRRIRPGRRPA